MNGTECWLALDRVGFQAAWLLLSALWQSSILLAAAGLLAWALRRRRPSVRHAILAAAILVSPLIPLLGWAASRSAAPQAPIPVMPTYSAPVVPAGPAEASPPAALPPEALTPAPVLTKAPAASEIDQAAAPQPGKPKPQVKPLSLPDCPWALSLLAYAAGATGLLCLVAVGKYRIGRWARRGRVVTDPRVLGIFRAARRRLGLDRDVIVVESRRILSPLTVGTLHPVILLPAGLAQESCDDDLLAIALHELTHVRRCDSLLLTTLSLVRAVMFFHPLVWLACRQVSTLAESACDDAVLDATGEPVSYARMLARLAEQLPRRALATELAAGIVWSKGAFLRRVEAILSDRREEIRKLSRVALLATLLAAMISVAVALALPLGERNEGRAATPSSDQSATGNGKSYNHFLFMRHNEKDGTAVTDTLVLAEDTPDGFRMKDIYTRNNLSVGFRPLGAVGGKVYGIKIEALLEIDIATGRVEDLGQLPGAEASCYDAGRLYAFVQDGDRDQCRLRLYDFRIGAYRDVAKLSMSPREITSCRISPDHKFLGLFSHDGRRRPPEAYRLTLIEVKTGTVRVAGKPVQWCAPMTGAGWDTSGPRLVWLDQDTLLFLRDEPPPEAPGAAGMGVAKVAVFRLSKDAAEDILDLPKWSRRPDEPRLGPSDHDGTVPIVLGDLGRYRIDVRTRTLKEDDRLRPPGDYRLIDNRKDRSLFHGTTALARDAQIPQLAIRPDGQAIIWQVGQSLGAELRFHDAQTGDVRTIQRGWFASWFENDLIWLAKDDLRSPPTRPAVPAGWTALADRPRPPEQAPAPVPPRPKLSDALTMTLATDKAEYRLHEPVRLTVALVSKSNQAVVVKHPLAADNVASFGLDYPRGGKVLDLHYRFNYRPPVPGPITLKPGEKFELTESFEVASTGEHRVEGGLNGQITPGDWQGNVEAAPVHFRVTSGADDKALLKAKFDRLMGLFAQERAGRPAWDGYSESLDGVAETGPAVGPMLVDRLSGEKDPLTRELLWRPLVQVCCSETIPFLKDCLLSVPGTEERTWAAQALHNMAGAGQDDALAALLAGLVATDGKVQGVAFGQLVHLGDDRVRQAVEKAFAGLSPALQSKAARYLAAAEGTDLAAWLTKAIEEPTRVRYLAGRSVVGELEQTWHISKGALPQDEWIPATASRETMDRFSSVLRAWLAWARENPRASGQFFDRDRQDWPKTEPAPAPNGANTQPAPLGPAWGDLVEGFAVRLRPAEPLVRPDGLPGFLVDFRNAAKRKIDVVFAPGSIRFEVDGVWYRPTAIPLGEAPAFSMGPGEDHLNVPFWPAVHWAWRSPGGAALPAIKPGRHTFRLAFWGLPRSRGEKRPVEVFSQMLEALIPGPATQPAPLGPAKSEDEKTVAELAGRFVKAVMSDDRQAAIAIVAPMLEPGTTQPSAEKTFRRMWEKAPELRKLYQGHADLLRAPQNCGVLGNMAFATYPSPASIEDVLAAAMMRQGKEWKVVDLAVVKLQEIRLTQSVQLGSATYGGMTGMAVSVGTMQISSNGQVPLPALGSPIERIVAYTQGFPSQAVPGSGAMFLDLDTGSYLKFGRLPDSGTIRKSGVDICYERPAGEEAGPRLATSGMQMQPLSKETGWQSDLKTVRHALMVASPYALTASETAPVAFSTGDGGIGILQIVNVMDSPSRVTIRYKLLQAGPAAATQPATLSWGKGPLRIQDGDSVIEGKRIAIEDGHMQVEGNAIIKVNNGAEVKGDRIDIRPNVPATQPAKNGQSFPTTEHGRDLFRKVLADIGKVDFLVEHWNEKGTNVGGPRRSLVLRGTESPRPKEWLSVAISEAQASQIVTKLAKLGVFDRLTDHTYDVGSPIPEWGPPQPKRVPGYLLHVLISGKVTSGEAFVDLSGGGDEAVARIVLALRADLTGQAADAADVILGELGKEMPATQPAPIGPATQPGG